VRVLRRASPDAVAAVAVALLLLAGFGPVHVDYDTFFTLIWGDQLASGELPDYESPLAPTPHPLAILIGSVLSPLGDGAEHVFRFLVLLAAGWLAVGVFRLGETLYAGPVGLLAAALLLTRAPVLDYSVRGFVDVPTAALVVWAAVLEARRPRRGAAVLLLLALAGLLRAEIWLFAAAYWLWVAAPLGTRERLRLGALAAAGPVLWALSDLAASGDPLLALNRTQAVALDLDEDTGLVQAPEAIARNVGNFLELPALIAAVLGLAAGLLWLRRRTLLPAALATLNGVAFLIFAAAELPLYQRFLLIAASMLTLFAAVAAIGWRVLEREHPRRRAWRRGGVAVLLGLAGFMVVDLVRVGDLESDLDRDERAESALQRLAEGPAAETALERCAAVYVPGSRMVPALAFWTGTPVDRFTDRAVPDGLGVAPLSGEAQRVVRGGATPPPPSLVLASNEDWAIYGSCGPGATP
jgi:hypothetical protein